MSYKRTKESIVAVQAYLQADNSLDLFHEEHGIRGKSDGNHIILNYDMLSVDWAQPYGWACRGLVLCAHTFNVLGFGLNKFFNSREDNAATINWETAKIFEKIDGTMLNRWFSPYTGKFEYSTRYQLPGDLEANIINDTGITWKALVDRCVGDLPDSLNQLETETIIFEITSDINRVVVKHNGFNCTLLARRCNQTLQEVDLSEHPLAPRTFNFSSLEEITLFANKLKGTESEGYVVVDDQFNRIKIKGEEYVRLHHLKNNSAGSLKRLILAIRHGEFDEVVSYFPEFKQPMVSIQLVIDNLIAQHSNCYERIKDIQEQKEFALTLQSKKLLLPGLLFITRAGKANSVEEAFNLMDDNKFIKYIEPLVKQAGITCGALGEDNDS